MERLLSAASVCVLVAAMATLNDEVNRFVSGVLSGESLAQLSLAGRGLRLVTVVTNTVGSYTGDHVALVIFGVSGVVLLGLMLRA